MHTAAALLDLHERTHRALAKLLDHCAGFPAEDLAREIDGFGYGTILLQLQHVIGAERYWFGVLEGRMLVDEDDADRVSIDTLRAFRERVVSASTAYLGAASDEELNTARTMTTWGDRQVELVPAHVVLRTQTHVFQHKGQIAAMCRLLGRPVPDGLDFPLG
jgi:uncharacterized damage-inducible protein DinB